jgi:hypothetical protein
MIFASLDHRPVLRVETYTPTAAKPDWARDQLARIEPFDTWRANGDRTTADCLSYWQLVATLEAIARGEVVYLLEDKAAEWAAQSPTAA